jgi:RNA polymerase sigma factor (sigma-70 family)
MMQIGIKNAAELSRISRVSQGVIGRLLNFKLSPRTKAGEWRQSVVKICRVLGSEPIDLFPKHLDREIATNEIAEFVEQGQLLGESSKQITPCESYKHDEMIETLDDVMGELSERERCVIELRFWEGKTLEEVGRKFGVTSTTARMNEQRALRKLRHPSRLSKLAAVCDFA